MARKQEKIGSPLSLIDLLLDEGVAVLLPDKRGAGAAAGDWRSASFQELAGDTLAAVAFVRGRRETRSDAVGLVGLSQGGKIAPIAAAQSTHVAYVINLSGAATTLTEQVSWEMYHTFREAGLDGANLQDALALQVLAEGYVNGGVEWTEYEAARNAATASDWAKVAAGFPAMPGSWQWDFFRGVHAFDPLPFWTQLRQPVLVVYGEDDSNAPAIRSVYRLSRAFHDARHPDAVIRVLPDTGHGLWDPNSADPHTPQLHPELQRLLRSWLRTRVL